jgi:hypothetical protein
MKVSVNSPGAKPDEEQHQRDAAQQAADGVQTAPSDEQR